jgi:hypothetical protein
VWDKDRLLLRRESQQGMYSVTSWFAARTLTTTPVEIAETALFCVSAECLQRAWLAAAPPARHGRGWRSARHGRLFVQQGVGCLGNRRRH